MSDFFQALKARASTIQAERATKTTESTNEAVESPGSIPALELTVDIVESRNRLDVSFNRIPEEDIRERLKQAGFRFSGERKCWYNIDCQANRLFLRNSFEVDLADHPSFKPSGKPNIDTVDVAPPVPMPATYAQYTGLVDRLCSELRVLPGDLAVIAVCMLAEGKRPDAIALAGFKHMLKAWSEWKESLN